MIFTMAKSAMYRTEVSFCSSPPKLTVLVTSFVAEIAAELVHAYPG